jgi:hypothetical protein
MIDIQGADLERDAALLQERQPRAREDGGLAESTLAVGELHQEVDMGVGDHARRICRGEPPVSD